ncbi:MAG: immune inhibitor A [Saprospiraceae bacterium]|nr:immune inhibitor A [Saprospiraceae bacterium]
MKKYTALVVLLGILANLPAQVISPLYHRVKVGLHQKQLKEISQLGIEADHGTIYPGKYLINDFSESEIETLRQADFELEILIEDVVSYYKDPQRNSLEERNPTECYVSSITDYQVPENFSLGSMGGFFTYQEMLEQLDAMHAKFPNLITERSRIKNHMTSGGNRIYWLKISDNPAMEEAEPEVLYTALHHAREPNSLAQLLFYMWYLLENYETDEEIRYLLDNTALYFIPCVNPDGYLFNQEIEPDGGGLWRKNRRALEDGFTGVDLNRNYGFHWGYDNSGSSPNPQSDVYRGTAPFSEVETRAVRDFCEDHNFRVALNCHTYGKLLVHPWGYLDTPTSDADIYTNWAELYTMQNNYLAGTGSETVGYTVNGDADDWMYGAVDIISMTPEVGGGGQGGGFWPSPAQIIPNCKASMWMNLAGVRVLHRFGIAKDKGPSILSVTEPSFAFALKRYGLEPGPLQVQLKSLSPAVEVNAGAKTYSNLDLYEEVQDKFSWSLTGDVPEGELVQFELSVNNGSFILRDTVEKLLRFTEPELDDQLTSADNWQLDGTWGITTREFVSAPSSMTDSPLGGYGNDANNILETKNYITAPEFNTAYLNFWARWITESDFDFVQVQIAINDGEYQPLCGQYSDLGTSNQREGEPLYDGAQLEWVHENIALQDFLTPGDRFKIRFELVSDRFLTADGFYLDDLQVFFFEGDNITSVEVQDEDLAQSVEIFPNPALDWLNIKWPEAFATAGSIQLIIYDNLGRVVQEVKNLPALPHSYHLELQTLLPGAYWGQLRNATGEQRSFQFFHQKTD